MDGDLGLLTNLSISLVGTYRSRRRQTRYPSVAWASSENAFPGAFHFCDSRHRLGHSYWFGRSVWSLDGLGSDPGRYSARTIELDQRKSPDLHV